jgi:hypothetical protein
MVLHTDQRHPHVHLVVKAENELGKRLHIDKAMLHEWQEHFAQLMRAQGIAANTTRRAVRGKIKRRNMDNVLRAQRHCAPHVMSERSSSKGDSGCRTVFCVRCRTDRCAGTLLE